MVDDARTLVTVTGRKNFCKNRYTADTPLRADRPVHGRHGDGEEAERGRPVCAQLALSRQRLPHPSGRSQTLRLTTAVYSTARPRRR